MIPEGRVVGRSYRGAGSTLMGHVQALIHGIWEYVARHGHRELRLLVSR